MKTDPDNIQIHTTLKIIRQFHGLAQCEFADIAKMSRSYVSEIEAGKKTPSLSTIEKYASAFQIEFWAIFQLHNILSKNLSCKFKQQQKINRISAWQEDLDYFKDKNITKHNL